MKEMSISRHWMRLENSIRSESNLEQDENWMTASQGSQLAFSEKLFSASAETYNHSKVFHQTYRLTELRSKRNPGDGGVQLLHFVDKEKEGVEIKTVARSSSGNWTHTWILYLILQC